MANWRANLSFFSFSNVMYTPLQETAALADFSRTPYEISHSKSTESEKRMFAKLFWKSHRILISFKHLDTHFLDLFWGFFFSCFVQSYILYWPMYGCHLFLLKRSHFLSCIIKHGVWLWTPNTPHQNCSLNLQSIYILSWASFDFHQLHCNLPKSAQKIPVFISDSAPYSLCFSHNICIPPTPTMQSYFNPLIACQQV